MPGTYTHDPHAPSMWPSSPQGLELAVPGTYIAGEPLVTIAAFAPTLHVINSKQRPRKLTIHGGDGAEYMFLLKVGCPGYTCCVGASTCSCSRWGVWVVHTLYDNQHGRVLGERSAAGRAGGSITGPARAMVSPKERYITAGVG